MSLTTIPIQKETRDKLREFASKSESWDDLVNRLYDNAVVSQNANIFFSGKSVSGDELLKKIEQW